MKTITINSNLHGIQQIFIDDEDYNKISSITWSVIKTGKNLYAASRTLINGKYKTVRMHRLILDVLDSKIFVDHKDHNGLNNQKENLRLCTQKQNNKNRRSYGNSIYLGVNFNEQKQRWIARIFVNNKEKYLGLFSSEIEAAKAYDAEAKIHHKEFANLNFK